MKNSTLWGTIIILIGLSILLHFPIINFLIAFVIIWAGIKIITGQSPTWTGFSSGKGSSNENRIQRVLIFSGINSKLNSENLEGINLTAVFGGGKVDVAGAKTSKKDIDIELVAIFGGIKLILPKNWKVESEGTGIFGSFDNRTEQAKTTTTVHLKGAAIFGGVEVVNS